MLRPHQKRVIVEKKALDKKLAKLAAFRGTVEFLRLSEKEQGLLTQQYVAMDNYSSILWHRIMLFLDGDVEAYKRWADPKVPISDVLKK